MANSQRNIFILEDDIGMQERLSDFCNLVHRKIYGISGNIITATDLEEAFGKLKDLKTLHFASVDLNLQSDIANAEEPKGFEFLEKLQEEGHKTASIVVSAEKNVHFSGKSMRYGVLVFQDKSSESFRADYLVAVEAIFYYSEAIELADNNNYEDALIKWEKANEASNKLSKNLRDLWQYPRDIQDEYKMYLTSFSERATNELRLLFSKDAWTLIYVRIEHLTTFTKVQGNVLKREFAKATRLSLQKILENHGFSNSFIGQISEDIIIIIINSLQDREAMTRLTDAAKRKFEKDKKMHYNIRSLMTDQGQDAKQVRYIEDGEEKYGQLATLTFGVINGKRNRFYDPVHKEFIQGDIQLLDEVAISALDQGYLGET